MLTCLLLSSLALLALGTPTPATFPGTHDPPPYNSSIRPLVLWHGLGDTYASVGMKEFAQLIRGVHPGIFVHNIWVDEDVQKDQKAGFFGNVEDQLEIVWRQIQDIPELERGFDALGFSQGGQFLRAYVEKFNSPPVHNLLTFGSQHMGVSDLPTCRPADVLCLLARSAARRGVYSSYAQHNLIQAQYFRDPARLDTYLEVNTFLTAINGEVAETRNETYKRNFEGLETFVMVLFAQDKTVVPKESSWFGSYAPPQDKDSFEPEVVLPMRQQPLYVEDWIGLRKLDEAGQVVLISCEGEHMQISHDCWHPLVEKFAGGVVPSGDAKGSPPLLRIQS